MPKYFIFNQTSQIIQIYQLISDTEIDNVLQTPQVIDQGANLEFYWTEKHTKKAIMLKILEKKIKSPSKKETR